MWEVKRETADVKFHFSPLPFRYLKMIIEMHAHTKGFIKKRISADIPQQVYTDYYVYDAGCSIIDFTVGCNVWNEKYFAQYNR